MGRSRQRSTPGFGSAAALLAAGIRPATALIGNRGECYPLPQRRNGLSREREIMAKSALSRLCLAGFASLAVMASAGAQSSAAPNFDAGMLGWVHDGGATFPPVAGSPSPVVQDPKQPFISQGASWRIGDLSNPNLKPWVKEVMKKDNDEINHGKIAFQARSSCLPSGIPNMFLPANTLLVLQTPSKW